MVKHLENMKQRLRHKTSIISKIKIVQDIRSKFQEVNYKENKYISMYFEPHSP